MKKTYIEKGTSKKIFKHKMLKTFMHAGASVPSLVGAELLSSGTRWGKHDFNVGQLWLLSPEF
jgi:hypothetical protein